MVNCLKNDKTKKYITVLLGLCIVFARVIYPTHTNITKATVIIEFLMELAICIGVILINKNELKKIFSEKKKILLLVLLLPILIFVGQIISSILVQVIFPNINFENIKDPASEVGLAFANTFLIPVIITQCILAPITEEIVFRKTIKDLIENNILYIFVSSFLFGFIHVGFNLTPAIFTYIFTGIIFNLIYLKVKNIKPIIYGHILFNTVLNVLSILISA